MLYILSASQNEKRTQHIKVCFSLSFLKSRWLYFTFGIYSNEYKGLILLVLLECCSIFKVLSAAAFVDSFVIISPTPSIVNTFPQSFFQTCLASVCFVWNFQLIVENALLSSHLPPALAAPCHFALFRIKSGHFAQQKQLSFVENGKSWGVFCQTQFLTTKNPRQEGRRFFVCSGFWRTLL